MHRCIACCKKLHTSSNSTKKKNASYESNKLWLKGETCKVKGEGSWTFSPPPHDKQILTVDRIAMSLV